MLIIISNQQEASKEGGFCNAATQDYAERL